MNGDAREADARVVLDAGSDVQGEVNGLGVRRSIGSEEGQLSHLEGWRKGSEGDLQVGVSPNGHRLVGVGVVGGSVNHFGTVGEVCAVGPPL